MIQIKEVSEQYEKLKSIYEGCPLSALKTKAAKADAKKNCVFKKCYVLFRVKSKRRFCQENLSAA